MIVIGFILIAAVILCGYSWRPVKQRLLIRSEKVKRSVKLIQISDFHCGKSDPIIDWIDEEKPDLIVITGDLFDRHSKPDKAFELIRRLNKNVPIYFISGNHEYRCQYLSHEALLAHLKEDGIRIIDDQIEILDCGICLIGIADCLQFETGSEMDQEKAKIERLLNQHPERKDFFQLVLLHRPDHYTQFDEPIDLMLSGHAHGGQWRIPPWINGLYAPQQGIFPKRAGGVYPIQGGVQLVSRGLARCWWLPRFFNRPELNIIEIEKISG